MVEQVNHPKHYNNDPSGVECIEIIRNMSFNIGCAVKYLWRMGFKDGNPVVQDMNKALFYLEDELAYREKGHDRKIVERPYVSLNKVIECREKPLSNIYTLLFEYSFSVSDTEFLIEAIKLLKKMIEQEYYIDGSDVYIEKIKGD